MAGPTPGGANSDADSVENAFDNCSGLSNAAQKDLDHDGCGDVCDADFDQDGISGILDFGAFKASFGKTSGSPGYDARTDMDCDGTVGILDFGLFKAEFGGAPGPSGLIGSLKSGGCP
jgi:hypothetical protein